MSEHNGVSRAANVAKIVGVSLSVVVVIATVVAGYLNTQYTIAAAQTANAAGQALILEQIKTVGDGMRENRSAIIGLDNRVRTIENGEAGVIKRLDNRIDNIGRPR